MTLAKFIVLGLVGLYLLFGIGAYFFQEKLIFLPEELPRDFEYEFDQPFTEHFLTMKDGAEINALHFNTPSDSNGLIVYFHGNAGSLERWGEVVDPFVELGFDVLIIDYRGYGKSTGERTSKAMLSDAEEIYAFAKTLKSEQNIVVFGRSLGSSFASHLAGKYAPAMVILETPFYSLKDVAKNVLPIYPVDLLLRFQFKNFKALESASCPIYIFHGTADRVVPFESGERLYQSLSGKQAEMIVIEDGGHNNLAAFEKYWSAMNRILIGE